MPNSTFMILALIVSLSSVPQVSIANDLITPSHTALTSDAPVNDEVSVIIEEFRRNEYALTNIYSLLESKDQIINYVQSRLLDDMHPVSRYEARLYITMMSLLDAKSAHSVLSDLANRFSGDTKTVQHVFRVLPDLPYHDDWITYTNRILERSRNNVPTVRLALRYLLSLDRPVGSKWAGYYRRPGINTDLRVLGMALSAKISPDVQVTRWIINSLRFDTNLSDYHQYILLKALHDSVSQDEFDQVVNVLPALSRVVSALNTHQLETQEQYNQSNKLTSSPSQFMMRHIVRNWLSQKSIEVIWNDIRPTQRHMAWRQSLNIDHPVLTDAVATEKSETTSAEIGNEIATQWHYGAILLVIVFFVGILARYRAHVVHSRGRT